MLSNTIADVLAGRASWAFECRDGFALARELSEAYPLGAVDHIVGDPPYDEQTHAGARVTSDGGKATPIDFAALPEMSAFVPALIACSRRWVVLACAAEMLGDYKRAGHGQRDPKTEGSWVRAGFWHRTNSLPQLTGDRPSAGCEAIAILHARGGKMRWNRGGHQAFWEGPICADEKRIHPTKKPLWLMEELLLDFTDPGDIVFDPTAGEGTTGEACRRLGRRWIGCEIDPKYHAAGVARVSAAVELPPFRHTHPKSGKHSHKKTGATTVSLMDAMMGETK